MKLKVSVVVVHWNTPDLLRKLLKSLEAKNNLQISVIDNHSDKSVEWLKKEFPEINLIQNKKNVGYAKACNQGARRSNGKWLVFLNPDVLITAREIQTMIETAEKQQLDAFSPNPFDPVYKKPLPSGFSLLVEFTPLKYLIPLSIFSKRTLTGGLLFIRKEVFKKLGGWDERFFLWFEDSDLSKRLYDAEYRVGWIPARVEHVGGVSLRKLSQKEQRKLFFSSMGTYADKYFRLWGRIVVKIIQSRFLPKN